MTNAAQHTQSETPASSPPTIERIRTAVKEFEALQSQYRAFGANDTEPDGVFQRVINDAAKGKAPAIPRTGAGWELYSHSMDCTAAADALHNAALKVVQLIEEVPIKDAQALKSFIRDYCWRIY